MIAGSTGFHRHRQCRNKLNRSVRRLVSPSLVAKTGRVLKSTAQVTTMRTGTVIVGAGEWYTNRSCGQNLRPFPASGTVTSRKIKFQIIATIWRYGLSDHCHRSPNGLRNRRLLVNPRHRLAIGSNHQTRCYVPWTKFVRYRMTRQFSTSITI